MTKSTSRTHAFQNFQKIWFADWHSKTKGQNPRRLAKADRQTTARRNLAAYSKMGCPKVNNNGETINPTLPDGEELAYLILGDDYLSPEDVQGIRLELQRRATGNSPIRCPISKS